MLQRLRELSSHRALVDQRPTPRQQPLQRLTTLNAQVGTLVTSEGDLMPSFGAACWGEDVISSQFDSSNNVGKIQVCPVEELIVERIQRASSSSDKRLLRLYAGKRGLPFTPTDNL